MDRFYPGSVYEVGTTVGAYLLALGAAEPVDDDTPAEAPAPERQLFGPVVEGHAASRLRRFLDEKAADRPRRKPKKR